MVTPRHRNDEWTADEDAVIYLAKRRGQCVSDIMPALPNRNRKGITNRMIHLGVRIPQSPERRMVSPSAGTDAEIRRLCSYLTNDSLIAHHIGVSIDRVTKIRAAIRQPRVIVEPDEPADIPQNAFSSKDGERRRDDVRACAKLRDAMVSLYAREAKRRRVSRVTAMLTLNYGAEQAARFAAMKKGAPHA